MNLKNKRDDSYDIIIGKGLASIPRELTGSGDVSKYFVITDSNVEKLYRKKFLNLLGPSGLRFHVLTTPAGEKTKNRSVKEKLEDRMLMLGGDRDSAVIAFGGGMVGDLAGYTASTFMRGIPYIQIPTSLLSQVDSSIGGKVAVNHPAGKNLIGAFYQPRKVFIDTDTLTTLPRREFRSGMAEVIKYAAIMDRELFSFLENNHRNISDLRRSSVLRLVSRCCELKKNVVEKDERESGLRRILNFGHTIGHALESLSAFGLTHGEAVAIGMASEARLSVRLGLMRRDDLERLLRLIKLYRLPTLFPDKTGIRRLMSATSRDKKSRNGSVGYTLLERIGVARMGVQVPWAEVSRIIGEC